MQHPDEGTIHTWLDGELPADEAAALEKHIAECPECSANVAEARGLIAASSRIVSSLDIIPGGVIPAAAPRRRAWYMSTQLRAAAAVVIVAGASLVVMQNRGSKGVDSVMTVSARAPELEAMRDSAALRADVSPQSASPAASPPVATAVAPSRENARVGAATGSRPLQEKMSGNEVMQATPPPPIARDEGVREMRRAVTSPSDLKVIAPRPDSARRSQPSSLSEIVVTGVATAASAPEVAAANIAPEFRKIRSDTVGAVSHTVFATPAGIQVTLTDADLKSSFAQRARSTVSADAAASAPGAVPAPASQPPVVSSMPKASMNTITWTDKRGHRMTLQGLVSKEKLEELRKTLPEDQR